MSPRPDISVVIPAYNEEARLEPTVRAMAAYLADRGIAGEILVVDDGSRDGTCRLVHRLMEDFEGLHLLRLPANRGKGYAVRAGMVNARGRLLLFADADGATPISEVERLRSAVDAGAHMAIGSRAVADHTVEVTARLHRRLIGRGFHLLVSWLAVSAFRDTQCGFKLFRANVAHDLFSRMRMNGFSFDVELLLMAKLRGYSVAEVPVNWTHQPGSRVNLVLDSMRMARDLFVIRSHLIRGDYREPHLTPAVERTVDPVRLPASSTV